MEILSTFFNDIKLDMQILYNHKEEIETKTLRIASVALRIIGVASGVLAVCSFIAGLPTIAGSPLAALILLVSTAVLIVFAHESFVIGMNISKENTVHNPTPESGKIHHYFHQSYVGGQKIYHEYSHGTPHKFRNTWIAEPIYKLMQYNNS